MDARTLKGIRLRHTRTSGAGFPAGREFRYVVYDGRILAHGYYWDGEDSLGVLSTEERATVAALVKRSASLTASESGNIGATSGARTTMLLPAA